MRACRTWPAARFAIIRLRPICKRCRDKIAALGDETPIAWLSAEERYVEKLATPDVTIADMIGDIDPIKAARTGQNISERVDHALWTAAARQSRIVCDQRAARPRRQSTGRLVQHHAGRRRPDQGLSGPSAARCRCWSSPPIRKIIRRAAKSSRRSRIASEARSARTIRWRSRRASPSRGRKPGPARRSPVELEVPPYIHEVVEQIAFLARDDKRVDKRSGVSQRLPITVLENVVSNAERRALKSRDAQAVPRILDLYAALPSITGKLELEYEGELKGGDAVARELIRNAVGKVLQFLFRWRQLSGRSSNGLSSAARCVWKRTSRRRK